jgi:site-specific DNA-methyltransferase (adenine-specific)
VRLMHGDCLDVLPTLEAGSVDAVVTDPPYGTKNLPWDHSIDARLVAECLRISRGYCAFYYSNTRLWHLLGIIHNLGRDAWVVPWHKPNAMGFERKFAPQWVPVVVAYHKGCGFWGQDHIRAAIVPQKIDHPTPKQIDVTAWLIERASAEGGTVLDPFMGSGTTGVACVNTGRAFIGIEREAPYYAIAERRISEAQMQTRMAV